MCGGERGCRIPQPRVGRKHFCLRITDSGLRRCVSRYGDQSLDPQSLSPDRCGNQLVFLDLRREGRGPQGWGQTGYLDLLNPWALGSSERLFQYIRWTVIEKDMWNQPLICTCANTCISHKPAREKIRSKWTKEVELGLWTAAHFGTRHLRQLNFFKDTGNPVPCLASATQVTVPWLIKRDGSGFHQQWAASLLNTLVNCVTGRIYSSRLKGTCTIYGSLVSGKNLLQSNWEIISANDRC